MILATVVNLMLRIWDKLFVLKTHCHCYISSTLFQANSHILEINVFKQLIIYQDQLKTKVSSLSFFNDLLITLKSFCSFCPMHCNNHLECNKKVRCCRLTRKKKKKIILSWFRCIILPIIQYNSGFNMFPFTGCVGCLQLSLVAPGTAWILKAIGGMIQAYVYE